MAVRARGGGGGRFAEMPARRSREASPKRTKVWTESRVPRQERRVPVVYYLCRNGQLEHPHFMEVPLSSGEGLYLEGKRNRFYVLLVLQAFGGAAELIVTIEDSSRFGFAVKCNHSHSNDIFVAIEIYLHNNPLIRDARQNWCSSQLWFLKGLQFFPR